MRDTYSQLFLEENIAQSRSRVADARKGKKRITYNTTQNNFKTQSFDTRYYNCRLIYFLGPYPPGRKAIRYDLAQTQKNFPQATSLGGQLLSQSVSSTTIRAPLFVRLRESNSSEEREKK